MPENPQSSRDILAEVMRQGRETLVPHIAEMLRRTGIKEVDSGEERRRFWQRALTPEQEANLWMQEMIRRGITELVPGSPEVLDIGLGISKQVYPDRWDMMTGEGRNHESDQAEWAMKHARRGPPHATSRASAEGSGQAAPKVEPQPVPAPEPSVDEGVY